MSNVYNIFFSELAAHLETLERYARVFCHITYKDKMVKSAAAINNIEQFLRKHKSSPMVTKALCNQNSRDHCLGILGRINTVLTLRYLPNATGEIRDLTKRAIANIQDCLIDHAWY